ncbi:hypothetical protein [Mixta calida]|uniref:hypothetical protein n=1 Tax=Mixta calida TaxID=665913 RepID=UPI002897A7FC|nr:hypothetical protein [Mixta calida]
MNNQERQALIEHGNNLMMLNGPIASAHELIEVALAALTAEPVVPDGWEACSPEWIERNGPCSCANAPRLAFGSVGQHYHPHIFIDNTAQQYEALAGWKVVPIEPTWEMLAADGCSKHHEGQECSHHENRKRIWRAMLEASPVITDNEVGNA